MNLDQKALEAATEAYNRFECGSDVDHVRNILRAYLSASIPADVEGLVERLQEFAKATVLPVEAENGERLDHTDSLPWLAAYALRSQAQRIGGLERALEDSKDAARRIMPYLRWTISNESPGHHPTMPSAVAAFAVAFGWPTQEAWEADQRASVARAALAKEGNSNV